MKQAITLAEVKAKLKAGGHGGLVAPGECGCTLDDLAPCGACEKYDEDDEFINGCQPGYVFKDTRPGAPAEFMVRTVNQEPTPEDWARLDACC